MPPSPPRGPATIRIGLRGPGSGVGTLVDVGDGVAVGTGNGVADGVDVGVAAGGNVDVGSAVGVGEGTVCGEGSDVGISAERQAPRARQATATDKKRERETEWLAGIDHLDDRPWAATSVKATNGAHPAMDDTAALAAGLVV